MELLQIARLSLKIHFFLRDNPHLVEYLVEVNHAADRRVLEQLARLLEQHYVAAHYVVYALALYLDNHLFARL